MADKDPIAEHNADIVARLRASDEFIRQGLTEKPGTKGAEDKPAARTVARPLSRSRKR